MASSSPYSHSTPASSSSQSCNYDVFLSFRGEDTRKTFVDHLYASLVSRLISSYKDDETLPRGEFIRPSLFNAIEGSRIAVVIFSENYADYSWCLEELTHIMRCKVERELIVMPIFYGVTPSEVRKQEGEFGKGFAKQEAAGNNINEVESWKEALVAACEIAGWETKNVANGHESKAIKEIVDTISNKLFPVALDVDEDLVGMMTRVQELEAQLEIGSQDVRMIGIWGVGGSGKTTLVSSFCWKISCHFQGHCIVDNIRKESNQHGLKVLQQKIISRLFKAEMTLQDVEEGKRMISRLSRSKVLIILDDVDDYKQLEALVGSLSWFGSGSRIIITTRYEHLLLCHKVALVYPMKLLSDEEAIELFNKRAYNEKASLKDYNTLSSRVVSYAARLPLALKVLSSFLYDKDENEWWSTLDRLKVTPPTEILEQLIISYDGLENEEKEIFLDIACFFRWKLKDKVIEILEACGYQPNIGIKVLIQKALITIVDDEFNMHDLVQEMGHYIVRRKHPNDPTKRSRVWKHEDIENLCGSDATTVINENEKIEAIECFFPDHVSLFCKNIVSNMKKLRYLHVSLGDDDVKNAKGPRFLSNELRYMKWKNYPRSPFPDTFKAVKLVILKLNESWQKKLWKGYKHLPQLKVLQLKEMKNLVSTPDFDGLPSLQKLTLHDFESLEKIHPSLGKHTSLEHLSVKECKKLRTFPTIIRMRKLKTLEIESCHKSLEFPEIESNIESLVKLSLARMGIGVLLSCIGERCSNLVSLKLYDCFYSMNIEVNFDGLKHLEQLELPELEYRKMSDHICTSWLIHKVACGTISMYRCPLYSRLPFVLSQLSCNLRKLDLRHCRLEEIPSGIGEMSNLEVLDLSRNQFTRLDFTLSQLTRLKFLDISDTSLVELPKLPSNLIVFKANDCSSLTTIGYCYINCKWLCDVSLYKVRIMNDGSKLLEIMLQGKAVENHNMFLLLEGVHIAKGFIPPLLVRGTRCILKLPENWHNNFSGFVINQVYCCRGTLRLHMCSVSMKQVMSGMESEDEEDVAWEESHSDRFVTKVWYVSFASLRDTRWWNSIYKARSISFQVHTRNEICSGFGVRMVAKDNRSGPTETSSTQEELLEFSQYSHSTGLTSCFRNFEHGIFI